MIQRTAPTGKRPHEGGFTLIELLVVIIILGILSGVVVFAVGGIGDKGQAAATKIDARTVQTAEEAFCAKNGRYGDMGELVTQGFLSEASTLTNIRLESGGGCKGSGIDAKSGFSISKSDSVVEVAGPEDNWPDDPGTGIKSSAFGYPLNLNVYEPLIYVNSDYTFRGGLAESWELIPVGDARKPTRPYNNGTWRFKLRQGVKFHDGTAFDAEDVMWTWQIRQAKGKTLSTVVNTLGFDPAFPDGSATPKLNSVEKIDDFTVDFTPKIPNLRLPEQIVHPEGAIVRRGHNFDDPNGASGGWGTGPFKVVTGAYTPRVAAAVERFDPYWDQSRAARVKRMNVTFFSDPIQRANALLSNQFDMAIDLPAESTVTAQAQGLRVVRSRQEGRNEMIMVNKVGNAGFAETTDRNVRQAISKAIDRADYVNTVYGPGNAAPGRYMSPPGALGSFVNLVAQPTMNQPEARSLLASSGYVCVGSQAPNCNTDEIRQKGGKPLKLVMFGIAGTSPTTFSFLAGKLKAVGIDSDIRTFATTPPRSAFYNANVNAPQWHLDIESPNQNDGNPAFFPYLRFYGKLPATAPNPPGSYRFAPCFNGLTYTTTLPCAFDDWGDKSNVASPTTAVSVQEASAQMQKILVNDEAIAIPLAGRYRIIGMKSSMNLTDPHPSNTNQQWVTLTKAG